MEYTFSKKAANVVMSPIRAIAAKKMGEPDFIKLSQGNPASEAIPSAELAEMSAKALAENPMYNLQYGPTLGTPELVGKVMERLKTVKGIPLENNTPIIVSGSQEGLFMMPLIYCNEGDVVLCDDFTFAGALMAIDAVGAKAKGVAMDDDGMMPDALEQVIQENPNAKYIYLIPNFQNPTGMTMPLERRKAIYDIAVKYSLPIYEDDPYGEIIFEGDPVPAFKSFDTENLVVYAGSFSKSLSAGLRVGFLLAPNPIAGKLAPAKAAINTQPPVLNQMIISKFMDEYDYEAQLDKTRAIYGKKYKLMADMLDEKMPACVKRTYPVGGMFVWITFPDYVDEVKILMDCMDENVGVVNSASFAADPAKPGKSFRLNFSFESEERIVKGIERLAKVAHQHCK